MEQYVQMEDLKIAIADLKKKFRLYQRLKNLSSNSNSEEHNFFSDWDLSYLIDLIMEDIYQIFDQESPICNIIAKNWCELKDDYRYQFENDTQDLISEIENYVTLD